MNKYQAADECAEKLIGDLRESNKLEMILRQIIKQAFIAGTEYEKRTD